MQFTLTKSNISTMHLCNSGRFLCIQFITPFINVARMTVILEFMKEVNNRETGNSRTHVGGYARL